MFVIVKDYYNRDVVFLMKVNENELFIIVRVIIVKILGMVYLFGLVE